MIINNDKDYEEIDLQQLYSQFSNEHRNIFIYQIENEVFICRTLGRIEFKNLVEDERWTNYEREEIICEACTLYPENYDFDNCDAGIPTRLTEVIIKRSGLDSIETRKKIMNYYREEMSDLDHQITCMINEAFPQHDIEEIETWDIEKTAKYLSRAEWKLAMFRGMDIYFDPFEEGEEYVTEELGEEEKEDINLKGQTKEKLTPEKLAQLEAQFPDINWRADEVVNKGIDALKDNIDTTNPALRAGI